MRSDLEVYLLLDREYKVKVWSVVSWYPENMNSETARDTKKEWMQKVDEPNVGYQKSLIFASVASNVNFQNNLWWIVFAPQIHSDSGYLQSKRIWKNFQGAKTNHQRFPK